MTNMTMKTCLLTALLFLCGAMAGVQAQVMKAADLEKYAKEKYGDKWLDAAANLAKDIKFDKNQSLTYQQVCIIISSTIDAIADHTGTIFRYIVNITPIIRIDIKEGKVRVTYTVQNYDILKVEDGGWLGALADKDNDRQKNQNIYSDGKRMNADKTDRRLYDEQWEINKRYPFVEKDAQKRTCSKALVMTHAYSNAILDKIEEAVKNGLVGNEDDDW